MLTRSTILLVILTIIATSAVTRADVHDAGTSWISVAPTGLGYVGPPAALELVLALNGLTVAATSASLNGLNGTASLQQLVAQAPFNGTLTGQPLSITIRDNASTLLRIDGHPVVTEGAFALRVTAVEYPMDSPLVAVGPEIISIEHGWNDETLTVGIAWANAPTGVVEVTLDAETESGVFADRRPVTEAPGGAFTAEFHLARLPAILDWRATITVDGVAAGTTGSRVSFPTRSASQGFFHPEPGRGLVAAGGFHEVSGHKDIIRIDAGLLAPTFEGASVCPESGAYDTVNGETWRMAALARAPADCPGSAPTAGEVDTPERRGADHHASARESLTPREDVASLPRWSGVAPGLLLKVLVAVASGLAVVYLVVNHRRRMSARR